MRQESDARLVISHKQMVAPETSSDTDDKSACELCRGLTSSGGERLAGDVPWDQRQRTTSGQTTGKIASAPRLLAPPPRSSR